MTAEIERTPLPLGRYAGFVSRFSAFVIDRAIIGAIAALCVGAINYVLNAFRINVLLGFTVLSPGTLALTGAGIALVLSLTYDIGFWMLAGQTPGKRLMGVRILRMDGGRIRIGNAVRREIGYWLSAILFLGYLWILIDNQRQGFHDMLAGTMVVYSWPEGELKGTFVHERVESIRQRRLEASRREE